MTKKMQKLMAFPRVRAAVGFAAIVAGAFLSLESAEATPLPNAASFVGISTIFCSLEGIFNPFAAGCPVQVPGVSAIFDKEGQAGGFKFKTIIHAGASRKGPNANVQGETSADSALFTQGSAGAEVDYVAQVTNLGLVLNVSNVPLIFMADVAATASGAAYAFASASSPFGSITACSNDLPNCVNSPANSISGSVRANIPFDLSVFAAGASNSSKGFGGFLAAADPVLAIADALIPGTNINFRDAFAISVSPDVTQSLTPLPAAVPEPGTLLLTGAGFVLVGAARRRKPRSNFRVERCACVTPLE